MMDTRENTGSKISDIPCNNIFNDICPRARDIKERINKGEFIKIKATARLKKTLAK